MSVFRFRQFSVENTESAMKVNTDGVLLGALMTVRPSDMLSLDVGTGTGTIALMAAQRLSTMALPEFSSSRTVFAIDSDGPSAHEASRNFASSPWPDMLEAFHVSLEHFREYQECGLFDHIFSNPPYYDMSLSARDDRRNAARHTGTLSYRELADFASRYLAAEGILSLILPADTELWLMRHARMSGLHPCRIVRIRTTARKRPSRIMAEFSCVRPEHGPAEEQLVIHEDGGYSREYAALTEDFYL